MTTSTPLKTDKKKVPSAEIQKEIENSKRTVAHLEAAAAYHSEAAARYHSEAAKHQVNLGEKK